MFPPMARQMLPTFVAIGPFSAAACLQHRIRKPFDRWLHDPRRWARGLSETAAVRHDQFTTAGTSFEGDYPE